MRGINHPSIVKLLSFSESDEHYFLVLERACSSGSYYCVTRLISACSDGGRRALPPNVCHFLYEVSMTQATHRCAPCSVKLTYFSEQLSRHVILQVAHGIRHLHEERGVVHRYARWLICLS